jgi:hypothetical protein
MKTQQHIPDMVKLPFNVSMDIVMQGFRIRFGRSLITVFGVLLGIMFLISSLTTFIIKGGVREEDRLRVEANRMESFLVAEMGSPEGRTVGVLQTGVLSEVEKRLVKKTQQQKPKAILWHNLSNATSGQQQFQKVTKATLNDIENRSRCIIITGEGSNLNPAIQSLSKRKFSYPIALTKINPAGLSKFQDLKFVNIAGEPTQEDLSKMAEEKRKSQNRLIWILTISLLVTIMSISNAMLMSVAERFREIGTMKCLGAESKFVRRIFLIESSMIGFCGGLGGAVLGVVFAMTFQSFVYGFALVFGSINILLILGAILIGVLAGVILSVMAAIYPASIASSMVPADALRSNI